MELGSGGGNNASHMKAYATLTLTDLSPEMLELSRSLNPECEHIQGDMTTLQPGRPFDGVFVHDALPYLTTEEQLRAAIETAFVHTRPGGAAIFCPDHVRERFRESTDHGGHDGRDGDPRSLRYLQWTWDPAPDDTWYVDDFAYLLREGAGEPRSCTTGTCSACSRAPPGCRCSPTSASPHRRGPPPGSRTETMPVPRYSWRPTPLNLAKQHLATRAVGGPR